ncbi:MAG: type II toxin-antitoxin system antitoxin SocA domain-containing protein [Planctomycetota bacterium]
MSATAEQIARYVLKLASEEPEAELVSHMRLQKLLYYVQGWSLAWRGEPAFPEEIQAWRHGPVVRGLYSKFADYGRAAIDADREKSDDTALRPDLCAFVRSVWEHYKRYSAAELRRMTHQEPPYQEAWGDRPAEAKGSDPIRIEHIAAYFDKRRRETSDVVLSPAELSEAEAQFQSNAGRRLDDVIAAEGWSA